MSRYSRRSEPALRPKQRVELTTGKIAMRLRILDGCTLEITVRDWGRGIENLEQAMTPLYTTGGEERSGMGFTIMDSFMDKLRVRSAPGKGTSVCMQRFISPRRLNK